MLISIDRDSKSEHVVGDGSAAASSIADCRRSAATTAATVSRQAASDGEKKGGFDADCICRLGKFTASMAAG